MATAELWNLVGSREPELLVQPTIELHWALQILASAGQTFAEPTDDDSHRATHWDPGLASFVGVSFAGQYPFRVALRPADLTLQLVERSGEALGTLALEGKTLEEGYDWLAQGAVTYMGGALPIIARPEYELPPHPIGEGERFSTNTRAEFEALSALFATSAQLLEQVAEGHKSASSVRCWPHHFDIATLLTVDPGPDTVKTVGVGMAPMGGGFESWYWYVSPWPYPQIDALPTLAGGGRWHTEGWIGAVLEGSDVADAAESDRRGLVTAFLNASVDAATEVLSSVR